MDVYAAIPTCASTPPHRAPALFSPAQVTTAAVVGGVGAGLAAAALNAAAAGRRAEARNLWIGAVTLIVVLIALGEFVPAGPARALRKQASPKWLESFTASRAGPPRVAGCTADRGRGLPTRPRPKPNYNRQKSEPSRARALA